MTRPKRVFWRSYGRLRRVTSTHVEDPGIAHSLVVGSRHSGRSEAAFKMRDFRDAEHQVDLLKDVPVVAHRVRSLNCADVPHQRIRCPTPKLFDRYLRPAGSSQTYDKTVRQTVEPIALFGSHYCSSIASRSRASISLQSQQSKPSGASIGLSEHKPSNQGIPSRLLRQEARGH